jgi:hypothetical protein
MRENEILSEIRATREELVRRFHCGIPALIEHLRAGERAAESAGRNVVSLVKPKAERPETSRVEDEPE